jgi:riboflavin kinase/FMN adenylyltransferase
MKILATARELQPGTRKVCAAIGVFDGVHLGHQQVIRQTLADARQHEALALVITFDGHPNRVVAPDRVPPMIYSTPQRLRALQSLGVDTTLLIHFDHAFSTQTGEVFVRGLARDFGRIHSICVGSEFTFGHQRSGNVALLKTLGQELKFSVHGLAAVALDGETVSSTRIRDAVRSGDLDTASQMLGRAYALAGPVVRGNQLGRTIQCPTANLDTTGLVLPPAGVYAAHASVRGQQWQAAVNVGCRPTVALQPGAVQVEAHLLDFTGELYGEDMEIAFVQKLRDEHKFASLDELKSQIARDLATARAVFE